MGLPRKVWGGQKKDSDLSRSLILRVRAGEPDCRKLFPVLECASLKKKGEFNGCQLLGNGVRERLPIFGRSRGGGTPERLPQSDGIISLSWRVGNLREKKRGEDEGLISAW